MADSWQTIEQAAVSLRMSVRTVNRHISAGKLQSRLSPEGRREVLVSHPDAETGQPAASTADAQPGASEPISMASPSPEPASAFSHTPISDAPVDPQTVLALADNAAAKAEMAVTAYQTLARVADTQVRQLRRSARTAWAAVVVLAIGLTIAVTWATHRLTRSTVQIDHLERDLVASQQTADKLTAIQDKLQAEGRAAEEERVAQQRERDRERRAAEDALRTELATAREHAARAEGKLTAYEEQEQARQTRETIAAAGAAAPTGGSLVPSLFTLETPIADLSDEASVTASARESGALAAEKRDDVKQVEPATRPTALRRKARQPTTRLAPASDTSSASTADE